MASRTAQSVRFSLLRRGLDAARFAFMLPVWAYSGRRVTRYYSDLLQTHGYAPQALAERAEDKDKAFYQHLFHGVAELKSPTVLDIGCGMGDLLEFLAARQIAPSTYLGLDLVPAFVERCRERSPAPFRFECANFVTRRFAPHERYELVVSMGVMVSRVLGYETYVEACINKMLRVSRRYVLFNLITEVDRSQGNYQETDQVGAITYLPRPQLEAMLQRAARANNADYHINAQRIYGDSVDAFVHLEKRAAR